MEAERVPLKVVSAVEVVIVPSAVSAMGKVRAWQVIAAGLASVAVKASEEGAAEAADTVVEVGVVADNKQDKSPKCDMLS